MNSIYRGSYLTIIAATREDSNYGLLGISRRREPVSISLSTGSLLRFPSAPDIKTSTWASRGWAYQEALLPKRKLIFTDGQVYYECIRLQQRETFGYSIASFPPPLFSMQYLIQSPERIYDLIGSYSIRSLSFSDDIINAIQEIFRACNIMNGVRHLWGIPFFGMASYISMGDSDFRLRTFALSLT